MNRERLIWLGAALLLLLAGLLIGRQVATLSQGEHVAAFRQWFWEHRDLDLGVQVGLIFVGALGIAALLPRETGEDEEEAC
ncbi:MAG TPA: hypothetical protein ENN19_02195 [Chloroflexi bacterium]|nr:hypothetical protein [Chloroflexota bacterium]